MIEGVTKAAVRLWEHELPDKFDELKLGQKILIRKGVFAGTTLHVVGKLSNRFDKFVFCDHVKQD